MATTLVQFATTAQGGTAPPTAYGFNNTLGNFLCLYGRGAVTGVSDTQDNNWVQSPTNNNFWYVVSCAAGANSVTWTNAQDQVVICEFSGVGARQTTGIPAVATGSSMALLTNSVTPLVNGSLVIAFGYNSTSNSMTYTAGTNLAFAVINTGNVQRNAIGEWAVQTTAAAVQCDLASNTSIAWDFAVEVFAPPSGGNMGSGLLRLLGVN